MFHLSTRPWKTPSILIGSLILPTSADGSDADGEQPTTSNGHLPDVEAEELSVTIVFLLDLLSFSGFQCSFLSHPCRAPYPGTFDTVL